MTHGRRRSIKEYVSFCHIVPSFCHIVPSFRHIVPSFCHIIPSFCHNVYFNPVSWPFYLIFVGLFLGRRVCVGCAVSVTLFTVCRSSLWHVHLRIIMEADSTCKLFRFFFVFFVISLLKKPQSSYLEVNYSMCAPCYSENMDAINIFL